MCRSSWQGLPNRVKPCARAFGGHSERYLFPEKNANVSRFLLFVRRTRRESYVQLLNLDVRPQPDERFIRASLDAHWLTLLLTVVLFALVATLVDLDHPFPGKPVRVVTARWGSMKKEMITTGNPCDGLVCA
jgi:hypothetical protein